MDRAKLEQMSVDELWTLHLEISDALLLLEERLDQVRAPRVRAQAVPKYRNPDYQHRKQR